MSTGYRPSNWDSGTAPIFITSTSDGTQSTSGVDGQSDLVYAQTSTYVFDAVLDIEHEQRLEKTQHPVQTGANISSHAYLQPASVSMSILMSDVATAYASGAATGTTAWGATPSNTTPFTGDVSRSVSAYQTLLTLQANRSLLTVTTRLRTYNNMLVTSIAPREDYRTTTGLRARVMFEQVITATTSSKAGVSASSSSSTGASVSARPDATQSSELGVVQPSAVSTTTQTQFQYPQTSTTSTSTYTTTADSLNESSSVNVPGAGDHSSVSGQQSTP